MYEKPTETDYILNSGKENPKLVCNTEPSVDVVSRFIFKVRGNKSVILKKRKTSV